jgi:hypothetical protein
MHVSPHGFPVLQTLQHPSPVGSEQALVAVAELVKSNAISSSQLDLGLKETCIFLYAHGSKELHVEDLIEDVLISAGLILGESPYAQTLLRLKKLQLLVCNSGNQVHSQTRPCTLA